MIYSFEPFGYEGSMVSVETDLRDGISAMDIIGIADSLVSESRERVRSAFTNSAIPLPEKRILIALSPADLLKRNPHDLAIAMSILSHDHGFIDESILILGGLELNGDVRPVKGVHAAVRTAYDMGIKYVICHKDQVDEANCAEGMKILAVSSLYEAMDLAQNEANFKDYGDEDNHGFSDEVKFPEPEYIYEGDYSLDDIKGLKRGKRAMAIAVAGKLNILAYGQPGCGKTMLLQKIPSITPLLTKEESMTVTRIHSLAGLFKPHDPFVKKAPFRMPHQTATIEGMCGGGPRCAPGEISLAHNGTLFLDEAAEFRTSCLQMLRVPLESHNITLSRAGRTTVYPADFQLVLATNPCSCGNYGSKDKICLCSAKAIERYWKKFSDPLLNRIQIKIRIEREDTEDDISMEQMRSWIKTAYEIQRKRGWFNGKASPYYLSDVDFSAEAKDLLEETYKKHCLSPRQQSNVTKTALTIANMDGRESVIKSDIEEAVELIVDVLPFKVND